MVLCRETALGLAVAVCVTACFDSDEKFRAAETTTTGPPATTTSTEDSSSSGEPASTTSGPPPVTCRDAVECIRACALGIDPSDPEPDFSCIIECIEETGLTVNETYKLLKLIDCAAGLCEEAMECKPPPPDTTSGSSSGSDTGGSSSSSTSSADATGGGFLPPCLLCIFREVLQEITPGCEEFHDFCE